MTFVLFVLVVEIIYVDNIVNSKLRILGKLNKVIKCEVQLHNSAIITYCNMHYVCDFKYFLEKMLQFSKVSQYYKIICIVVREISNNLFQLICNRIHYMYRNLYLEFRKYLIFRSLWRQTI